MYFPLNYEKINMYASRYTPNTIKYYRSEAFEYWERALFQRLCSVIKWDNLPEDWTKEGNVYNFLMYCLIRFGYVVVSEDNEYGLWFNPCTLKGYNLYYQPTEAVVSHALFKKAKTLTISGPNKTGVILRLTDDYRGLWDIIDYYACKLALLDSGIDMSLINAKVPYIIASREGGFIKSFKAVIDKIMGGDPAAFLMDKPYQDITKTGQPVEPYQQIKLFSKSDYITDDLLIDRQKILDAFDNEVGIPTSNTEKRERMSVAEVTSKHVDASARANHWLTTLEDSINNVNDTFGTDISVELRIDEQKEDMNYGNEVTIDSNGTVPESQE